MAYSYYTNNTCTTGQGGGQHGDGADERHRAQLERLTFGSAGTFYWQAVYSGDANNNGDLEPVHGGEQRAADGEHRLADHHHHAVGGEDHGRPDGHMTRRH